MYTDCPCHRLYLHTRSLSGQSTSICHSFHYSTLSLSSSSVLGRRVGIQIISGTTRGSLLERAPTVNTSRRRFCNSSHKGSVSQSHRAGALRVRGGTRETVVRLAILTTASKWGFAIPAQGRNRGETGYAPTCPVLGLFGL